MVDEFFNGDGHIPQKDECFLLRIQNGKEVVSQSLEETYAGCSRNRFELRHGMKG